MPRIFEPKMLYDCRQQTDAPPCDLTCEEIQCEINAAKQNINNLFDRTDDLNQEVSNLNEELDTALISLNFSVTELQNKVAALEDEVSDINNELISIQSDVSNIQLNLANRGTIVYTYDELVAAVLVGGDIFIKGVITYPNLPNKHVTLTKSCNLIGLNTNGEMAKLVYPHAAGQERHLIDVGADLGGGDIREAANSKIINLELTTNRPIDVNNISDLDIAINTYAVAGWNLANGLVVDSCLIHHVGQAIRRQSAGSTLYQTGCRFTNNYIHSVITGIHWLWNTDGLLINNNDIVGVPAGISSWLEAWTGGDGTGNGILVGNQSNSTTISNNRVSKMRRYAIEYLQGLNGQIINNRTEDSIMGITTLGTTGGTMTIIGNYINRARRVGLELVNSLGDDTEYIAIGNTINDTRFLSDYFFESVGISVNGVKKSTIISDNNIGKVTSNPTAVNAFGLEMYKGCTDVTIENNRFTDAGNVMVLALQIDAFLFTRISINNNKFYFTPAYETTYPSPAFASFTSIQLNGANGVYTIKDNVSWFPTGKTFGQCALAAGGTGTIYAGHTADAPITVPGNIALSNIRIPY